MYYNINSALEILKAFSYQNINETLNLTIFFNSKALKNKNLMMSDSIKLPFTPTLEKILLVFTSLALETKLKNTHSEYFNQKNIIFITEENMENQLNQIVKIYSSKSNIYCVCEQNQKKIFNSFKKTLTDNKIILKKIIKSSSNKITSFILNFNQDLTGYKANKSNCISIPIGKLHFSPFQIKKNIEEVIISINKKKPSSIKGSNFIYTYYISSTNGPSLKIKSIN